MSRQEETEHAPSGASCCFKRDAGGWYSTAGTEPGTEGATFADGNRWGPASKGAGSGLKEGGKCTNGCIQSSLSQRHGDACTGDE